jgi:putative FmdB family regulatory protein
MPTYEYACSNGHHFELFQKMSDKPRAKCPTCGSQATRKISAGAGLVFKGSGFYITDYGKDGKGARKAEASEKPEAAPKPEPAPKVDLSPKASSADKPTRKAKGE